MRFLFTIFIMVGLFACIPSDEGPATFAKSIKYSDREAFNQYNDPVLRTFNFGGSLNHNIEVVQSPKSGLRRSIEGRLRWLGLADELSSKMICDEQTLTCERLF